MKILVTLFIGVICFSLNAQQWFDSSCKNIDETVIEEDFENANKRNIIKIIVNQAGEIEINDEIKNNLSEIGFKEYILQHITNPEGDKNKADKPDKIFVQLKSLNKDTELIQNLKSYVQEVYLYLWDKEATESYKSTYVELNCKKREKVFNKFPLKIISEVEKTKKKIQNTMRRGPGLPPFGGDVEKN